MVVAGAETAPPVLVAVMVSVMTAGLMVPAARVGAVNVTFAELVPVEVTARFTSAGAPDWATVKVSACAGTLGSVPLTAKLPAAVEKSVTGATCATVGAAAVLMVIVELALDEPQAFVAVNVAVTGDKPPTAEKMVLAEVGAETEPLVTAQAKVIGVSPVALPARATVPPLATV